MSSSQEANWLLSVKRAKQGDAHVWEQEETWLFHKCPELLRITMFKSCAEKKIKIKKINPAQTWGWTFLIISQKPEKKDEDRHFFSLIMRKNDSQEAFWTFLQYCLSFKSGQREMNAENSGSATKKDVSLNKTHN